MVDWQDIHRRLADARIRLDLSWSPDAAETRRILRARARALAQAPALRGPAQEWIEYLEFALADERYGIEIAWIREVGPATGLTPVPCTPDRVAGLIALRGQILSVLDLRACFGLKDQGAPAPGRVIVLELGAMIAGVLANAVLGLRAVARAELETSLPTLSGPSERYLKGVSRTGVALVDAQKLLSDPEIIVDAEREAGAGERNGRGIGA